MEFTGLSFLLLFLPAVLLLFLCLPEKLQLPWLLITGLLFFSWSSPLNLLLIPALGLSGWLAGCCSRRLSGSRRKALLYVTAGVQAAVVLAFRLGLNEAFGLRFPAGICFYGLLAVSYPLGLLRDEYPPERSPFRLTAQLGFFPLIMGPVVPYRELKDSQPLTPSPREFAEGIGSFVCGLSKLFLLARPMERLWREAASESAASAWLGLLGLALGIYFELSGYGDMARGLGQMLGVSLPQGFRWPFLSKSLRDFFRRFNSTLTSWLWQYVYIPLGGSRKGFWRTLGNMALVWLLGGLWHGGRGLLLWGLFFFLAAALERFLYGRFLEKLPGVLQWIYSAALIMVGWVFFSTDSLGEALRYFSALFGGNGGGSSRSLYLLLSNLPALVVSLIVAAGLPYRLGALLNRVSPALSGFVRTLLSLAGLVLCVIYAAGSEGGFLLFGRF